MKWKKRKVKLFTQMFWNISLIIGICTIFAAVFFIKITDDLSTKYLGEEAMAVAKLAAQDEQIIQAFYNDSPSTIIQPIAEKIRKQTGASYIVIGNTKGIRYSHPDPRFIGKSMGTSNIPVFKDHISVVYFGEGISGPAIKAKTPIRNDKGEIIGVSSVGFLLVDIKKGILTYRNEIIGFALFLLLIGITAAYFISRRIKRKIFNLEPEEISLVFKEKEAILESIHDGIIAVDKNYQVISMNKRARKMLENTPIANGIILPDGRLKNLIGEVIQTKKGRSTQKVIIGNQVYIIALSLITQENLIASVVISLQTEDEIEQIVNEVSEITSYTENMRALNHEFLNKLNTIYGLLSISEYEKAKELISDEVKDRQDIISYLMSSVKNPLLVACLLGKINRSKELKVDLEVDQDSSLSDIPETMDTKLLVSILSNIIDNAMEAAVAFSQENAKVSISFTDIGRDLIFDIQDNGLGISEDAQSLIFKEGFTTKNGENHGIGLSIVMRSLEQLHGEIYITNSFLGGAKFTIVIPKDNRRFNKED